MSRPTYKSTRLTFRRNVIERLGPGDEFRVQIRPRNGEAVDFIITKREFERVFANVLATRSWRIDGLYAYRTIPRKATPFLFPPDSPSPPASGGIRKPPFVPPLAGAGGSAGAPDDDDDAVRAWRNAWRPSEVRYLLIAESHVGPADGDRGITVTVRATSRPLPKPFCRLVYCLGYGESRLCSRSPEKNRGTPEFWRIFTAIAWGIEYADSRKAPRSREAKIACKLATLEQLARMGVWLVDASTKALFWPGGHRPLRGAAYRKAVRESWIERVYPRLEPESIRQAWVIGRTVGKALEGLPLIDPARIISQPGDRNRARFLTDLDRMAREIRGDVDPELLKPPPCNTDGSPS